MSAKKVGVWSLFVFALAGATTAHASPQRAAARFTKPVRERSLLALQTQPTSLVQVARTRAAIAAVRAQGGTLVSPQLNVWSLRSGAAQVLAARLAREGELVAAEPNRTLRRQGRLDAGDPLLPQEWWLHAVGADAAVPPGPGRPITVVDAGLDMTHPEFSSRPNTSVFNTQTTRRRRRLPRHRRLLGRGRAGERGRRGRDLPGGRPARVGRKPRRRDHPRRRDPGHHERCRRRADRDQSQPRERPVLRHREAGDRIRVRPRLARRRGRRERRRARHRRSTRRAFRTS